jgi:hypothetical protein
MFQDEFLDLLIRDLQRRTMMERQFGVIDETDKIWAICVWGSYTYPIRIRVAQVEKVLGVGRVGLGFEDVLDTIRAADTHGESHATDEDVHIVFGSEETSGTNVNMGDTSMSTTYLGSMTGSSYTLDDLTVTVPELSGFNTTGPCTASV